MKTISIAILIFIIIIQQLQINSLNKRINILCEVYGKLQNLYDNQINASKDMLELIKTQRDAIATIFKVIGEAAHNVTSEESD